MPNMYNGSTDFKDVKELAKYVDWVAKENSIDHQTAFDAIRANWIGTIQWRKLSERNPEDKSVWYQVVPELKPVVGEAWYKEVNPDEEIMKWIGSSIIDWITTSPSEILNKAVNREFEKALKTIKNNKAKENNESSDEEKRTWKTMQWVWEKNDFKKTSWQKAKEAEQNWNPFVQFGKNATSIEQIEARDKKLAELLASKWKTDIVDIENFLNKFPAFAEASDENKQRTIRRIYDNMKWIKPEDNKDKDKSTKWPQWIYVDQEDYTWTPEAKEWLDVYNKYAQAKAEWQDMSKAFKSIVWEAPKSWNSSKLRSKMKEAGLSTAQINDFVQDWSDAYYRVDNESPINDVKYDRKDNKPSLLKAKK